MKKNSLVIIIGILFFLAAAGIGVFYYTHNNFAKAAMLGEQCGKGLGAVENCSTLPPPENVCAPGYTLVYYGCSNNEICDPSGYNCTCSSRCDQTPPCSFLGCMTSWANSITLCDTYCLEGDCCWRATPESPWDCSTEVFNDTSKVKMCVDTTPVECATDDDCPADEQTCVNNDVQTTTYSCIFNVCQPNTTTTDCLEDVWYDNYPCSCEDSVCKIYQTGRDRGCRVIASGGSFAECFDDPLEQWIHTCNAPYSTADYCKDNSVYYDVVSEVCPPLRTDTSCYVQTNDHKKQTCGACSPTGNKRCGSFTPPICDDPILQHPRRYGYQHQRLHSKPCDFQRSGDE